MNELDALRGLAALAVTAFHYTTHYAREVGHLTPLPFGFPLGNYGVQVFFVISGFVIFMTIDRNPSPLDFVVSRVSRLYPTYWAAILLTTLTVYEIGLPQQRLALSEELLNFTMFQGILGAENLDGSYWTLQVELFFYVHMLLILATGQIRHMHRVVAVWLVLALTFGLSAKFVGRDISYTLSELLLVRHIPFFSMGVLFYRIFAKHGSKQKDYVLILASVAVVAVTRPHEYLWVSVFCVVLFGLLVSGRLAHLDSRPLVYLGTISYPLYLLHQAIGFDLLYRFERAGASSVLAVAVTFVLVLIASSILTKFVERPAISKIRAMWRRAQTVEMARR